MSDSSFKLGDTVRVFGHKMPLLTGQCRPELTGKVVRVKTTPANGDGRDWIGVCWDEPIEFPNILDDSEEMVKIKDRTRWHYAQFLIMFDLFNVQVSDYINKELGQ